MPGGDSKPISQFMRFCVVGAAAFLLDVTILSLGIAVGLTPFLARIPAVIMAILLTWLLNRRFTFATNRAPSIREFATYFSAMLFGLCVNLAVFSILISASATLYTLPQVAAFVGVLAGIVVNFMTSRRILRPQIQTK